MAANLLFDRQANGDLDQQSGQQGGQGGQGNNDDDDNLFNWYTKIDLENWTIIIYHVIIYYIVLNLNASDQFCLNLFKGWFPLSGFCTYCLTKSS